MAEGDALMNGIVGAVVGIVTAPFVPFSPVVGGAVAGYLQGGDRDAGLRVGALAGAIMLVPLIFLFVLFANFVLLTFSGMGGPPHVDSPGLIGGLTTFVSVSVLIFGLFYTVGLSALGGYLGNYLEKDSDRDV